MTRLNLGCNDFKLPGFTNVDVDPRVNPDVICDASALPYDDNSISEIYAGHLLEHFSMDTDVLLEWKRVLMPGGRITITVPDVEKGIEMLKNNEISLSLLNQIVFGATDRDEQNHHQVFTKDILFNLFSKYFTEVSIIEDSPYLLAKVNWQTIITGIKP